MAALLCVRRAAVAQVVSLAVVALGAAVVLGAGCNPRTGGGDGEPIQVTPAEITVQTGGEPVTARFTARTRGGEDVTAGAVWTLDDGRLGAVARGAFTTAAGLDRGGMTTIHCEKDGQTGTATVRVKFLAADLIEAGADDGTPGAFGGPTGGVAPEVVYPLPGAMLARNIAQMRLAWRADGAHRLYRVTLDSPTYQQTIYLGQRACAGTQCSYRVTDEDWARVANSAAGASLQLSIAGTAGAGEAVGRSGALTLHFSPEDVRGGMYYFSTTRYGVLRLPFGGQRAVPFLAGLGGTDTSVNRCIGCHAVSRDGRKVAAVWAGGDGYGGIVDGADPKRFLLQPNPQAAGQIWNFASFSPEGDKLIGVWKGQLSLRSGDNGSLIARVAAADLGGGRAAMPEWSPDGKWIVFVRIPNPDGRLGSDIATDPNSVPAGDWILGNAGDIAMLPYNDGAFGEAITIVPRERDREYHFYPSFSPDSRWIVFNSVEKGSCFSPTAAGNGVDVTGRCMTYDQRGARLRLVRAQEGAVPIELGAATHELDKTTAWPKFAPFQQAGGKLVFFTFSAKFDYGWVVQQAEIKRTTGGERPQIWMSAIDLSKAEAGKDPSYAPFWLPFQDSGTNNHEVIWTTDIACVKASDCGDEFDCTAGVCVPRLG
jgi:hypothetical protein